MSSKISPSRLSKSIALLCDANPGLDANLVAAINAVKSVRAQKALKIILTKGSINTEEIRKGLKETHPPRTAGDIKDSGIPLIVKRVTITTGKKGKSGIAEYSLGDPNDVNYDKFGGRLPISKILKKTLIDASGSKCSTCTNNRDLTVDHRVPYKISGNKFSKLATKLTEQQIAFQVLCRSCQLSKAKCCDTCTNINDSAVCESCFWAMPESYKHIGTKKIRRLELVWLENETMAYETMLANHGNDILKLTAALKIFNSGENSKI